MYARNTTGRVSTSRLGGSVIGRLRLLIEEIPVTTRFRVRRRCLGFRPGRLSQPGVRALAGCLPSLHRVE